MKLRKRKIYLWFHYLVQCADSLDQTSFTHIYCWKILVQCLRTFAAGIFWFAKKFSFFVHMDLTLGKWNLKFFHHCFPRGNIIVTVCHKHNNQTR